MNKLVNVNNSCCYGYAGLIGGGHGPANVPKQSVKLKTAAGFGGRFFWASLLGFAVNRNEHSESAAEMTMNDLNTTMGIDRFAGKIQAFAARGMSTQPGVGGISAGNVLGLAGTVTGAAVLLAACPTEASNPEQEEKLEAVTFGNILDNYVQLHKQKGLAIPAATFNDLEIGIASYIASLTTDQRTFLSSHKIKIIIDNSATATKDANGVIHMSINYINDVEDLGVFVFLQGAGIPLAKANQMEVIRSARAASQSNALSRAVDRSRRYYC